MKWLKFLGGALSIGVAVFCSSNNLVYGDISFSKAGEITGTLFAIGLWGWLAIES